MKMLNKFLWISYLLIAVASCKKTDDLDQPTPVGLGGPVWAPGPIDNWLKDSLTTPYNIAVKYRWDPFELSLNRTLTPPDESKIIPAMSAIKRVWIQPYNDETGSDLFIKKFSPKQFVLVGSVQYDFGTVILGQAEGGNNIVFYDINQNFDDNSVTSIQRMIRTSHHEFGHILHQNVRYPEEFKFINANLNLPGYTAQWFNTSDEQALEWGYITPYSSATFDEDFVEMIANMLMQGRTKFNEIVASTNATAQQALRQKELIVVNYFKEVYNIDFYSLQTRVQNELNRLIVPQTIAEAYGFEKTYTTASVNPADQTRLPQSSAFMSLYNTSKNQVAAIPDIGLSIDSMAVVGSAADSSIIRFYVKQNNNIFLADFTFALTANGNDVYGFELHHANGNGDVIQLAVTPLLDYFSNNQFKLTWYADPVSSIFPRLKFTPQGSPGSYFIGLLLP